MVEDLAGLVRQARQQLDQDSGRALQVVQAGQAAEADIARLGQQAVVYARVAALFTTDTTTLSRSPGTSPRRSPTG